MSFSVLYIVAILFVLVKFRTCTIPDYIHVCHHDDPDLGGCVIKSIYTLLPRLTTGIPELNIPSLDPFNLDFISFTASPGGDRNITNAQIRGASNLKILNITPTLSENGVTIQFEVIIPQLNIEGNYAIDTKILVLELKGKGPFRANITDYHFNCLLSGHKVKKDDVNHLEFDKMKCNANIGKTFVHLENLFDGDSVLGKATNDAINDNSEALFQEIRPNMLKAIRKKFLSIANKITLSFTYEELFP